eukprot:12603412-Alexandrium_andersonii.AAC.1
MLPPARSSGRRPGVRLSWPWSWRLPQALKSIRTPASSGGRSRCGGPGPWIPRFGRSCGRPSGSTTSTRGPLPLSASGLGS